MNRLRQKIMDEIGPDAFAVCHKLRGSGLDPRAMLRELITMHDAGMDTDTPEAMEHLRRIGRGHHEQQSTHRLP